MNWDTIEGQLTQIKGKLWERWGKLSDDDLTVVAGKREQLIGVLQKRYGITRAELERQVEEFERRVMAHS